MAGAGGKATVTFAGGMTLLRSKGYAGQALRCAALAQGRQRTQRKIATN